MTDIPPGFCHCLCGQRTTRITSPSRAKEGGYQVGEYRRFVQGHSQRMPKPARASRDHLIDLLVEPQELGLVDRCAELWVRINEHFGYLRADGEHKSKTNGIGNGSWRGETPESVIDGAQVDWRHAATLWAAVIERGRQIEQERRRPGDGKAA